MIEEEEEEGQHYLMSQEMIDLFGNSNLTSLLHNLEDNIKVEIIINPMEPVKIPLGTPLMKNMVK